MRISDWSSDVCSSDLPLTIGVRFRALETARLHSLLYRRHVRAILRQYRAPARIADRRVFPFGLRLFALGEQLVDGDFEAALVRIVAMRFEVVAERIVDGMAYLEVREDLPGRTAQIGRAHV